MLTTGNKISPDDISKDIRLILWSFRLHYERRYFHHRFWEKETQAAEFASKIEPFPRLESVAEHSWHVSDCVLILAPHFPEVNLDKAVKLALLHDKMEGIIGDKNPVGRDGTGMKTHAFSEKSQKDKFDQELAAIIDYSQMLRQCLREEHVALLLEALHSSSIESRFVKAVDKIQSLAYVITIKRGCFTRKHLKFTLAYSKKTVDYFPPLSDHYKALRALLLESVKKGSDFSPDDVLAELNTKQLPLDFED